MAKTYRTYLPEQDFVLPPSLRDWLPEDHLAYFVSDVVDELDLSAVESIYEKEERGQPPYHPRMMTNRLSGQPSMGMAVNLWEWRSTVEHKSDLLCSPFRLTPAIAH